MSTSSEETPGQPSSGAVGWKTVNVFVSSTFDDMHAERDYLVKEVFPRLREWCEQRRLRLVDVDLRWGVTEAAATNNKRVVDVCLRRIDDCRPFFICLLGHSGQLQDRHSHGRRTTSPLAGWRRTCSRVLGFREHRGSQEAGDRISRTAPERAGPDASGNPGHRARRREPSLPASGSRRAACLRGLRPATRKTSPRLRHHPHRGVCGRAAPSGN